MRYDHIRLDHGLELLGEHNPDGLSLAAGYFCRTGSRDEVPAESGVSHFLEHMLFKGTETLTYEDINQRFDQIGARNNAFTSEETTVYYGQVLPEYQGELVELLSQMMRPALRQTDFDMEKNVILEEIAMYQDDPRAVAWDRCRELHYAGHPLGNSVLGTPESITALARDQMADYYGRRYAPDNLTFAISGRYDWDAVVAQVAAQTAGWQPSGAARALSPVTAGGQLETIRSERFTQASLILMAPGPDSRDDRRYEAAVVAAALGSGEASRLHWALVDPGLAEEAELGHDGEDGAGAFSGVLICEPDSAQETLDIYRGVLTSAQAEGLREDEVQRAVRRFSSGIFFQAEAPLHRLIQVGYDWLYRGEVTPLEELRARLGQVTCAACNEILAARPFDRLSVVGIGPVPLLV